jgi:pantetheine-phosphate adenylyltransferase
VRRAVCPGSFDPVTNGHVDVITRAAGLYDELVVAVLVNPGKAGLFTVDERMELLRDAVADLPNVTVDSFQGLLVDYCRAHDIPVIVKGLRAVSDFEYELQMAQMNRELANVETLFVPTAPQVGHLSSSLVKQIAMFGGDVSRLVPKAVHERLLRCRRPAWCRGTTCSTSSTTCASPFPRTSRRPARSSSSGPRSCSRRRRRPSG